MQGICSVLGDNAGDDDDEISSRCMSKYHHDRSHYGHCAYLAALTVAAPNIEPMLLIAPTISLC
jgi:hypothetical protein